MKVPYNAPLVVDFHPIISMSIKPYLPSVSVAFSFPINIHRTKLCLITDYSWNIKWQIVMPFHILCRHYCADSYFMCTSSVHQNNFKILEMM